MDGYKQSYTQSISLSANQSVSQSVSHSPSIEGRSLCTIVSNSPLRATHSLDIRGAHRHHVLRRTLQAVGARALLTGVTRREQNGDVLHIYIYTYICVCVCVGGGGGGERREERV